MNRYIIVICAVIGLIIFMGYRIESSRNELAITRAELVEAVADKELGDELLDAMMHDLWHLQGDRDYYYEESRRYWQELIDSGVYEVEHEVNFEYGVLRSYEKVE